MVYLGHLIQNDFFGLHHLQLELRYFDQLLFCEEHFPIQDIFVYGKDTRMNTPGTNKDNWAYRITEEQLKKVDTEKFKKLNKLYSRI